MIGIKVSEKSKLLIIEAAKEKVRETADAIFEESQKNLVRPIWVSGGVTNTAISDTGELLKSGFVKHTTDSSYVIYSAPHADFIEFGRMPGSYPPVSVIEKWVRRKLRVPPKKAKQITFAIAQKIKKDGIAPKPFLRTAAETVSARLK